MSSDWAIACTIAGVCKGLYNIRYIALFDYL